MSYLFLCRLRLVEFGSEGMITLSCLQRSYLHRLTHVPRKHWFGSVKHTKLARDVQSELNICAVHFGLFTLLAYEGGIAYLLMML